MPSAVDQLAVTSLPLALVNLTAKTIEVAPSSAVASSIDSVGGPSLSTIVPVADGSLASVAVAEGPLSVTVKVSVASSSALSSIRSMVIVAAVLLAGNRTVPVLDAAVKSEPAVALPLVVA